MACDEQLADRFGGFLVSGHLAVAASGQGGMRVRCDPDDTDDPLQRADVSPFEMRGRGMRGWPRVETPADDAALREWVATGIPAPLPGRRRLGRSCPTTQTGSPPTSTTPRRRPCCPSRPRR